MPAFSLITPGDYVLHPSEDWGLGQVQSVDNNRVTCNFEHRGKVTINTEVIELIPAKLPNSDD
ncbi:MAG: DUF3553 domain-containing protein [Rhodospirillales bacterium]|jgi:hypothetical protein|nr:DUF3553 domain-containing protein [Rhodospirillales bacterium]MBT4625545.1 DUF3553 domain-containing protein [Rhodospirillales bacterium]MBT5352607.1 DUF3553 domain-containing protein [Rhodospirillales bacterium]MBT5520229.1 DUF3553 domain-containing protein [Rhodospirillales bacterium]MBT6111116.1 DUF3553 domain-containing protein [Rhodospirillales bacterium]